MQIKELTMSHSNWVNSRRCFDVHFLEIIQYYLTRSNCCCNNYSLEIKFSRKIRCLKAHPKIIINRTLNLCLIVFIRLENIFEKYLFIYFHTSNNPAYKSAPITSTSLIYYVLVIESQHLQSQTNCPNSSL